MSCPSRRTTVVVVGAVGLVCLALAGTASAHLRSGIVAVDYRASILHPATAAYSAQIYQSDHGLTLTRRPGHVIVMLGYLNEPVFRLDAAGSWVNVASPTAAALRLVPKAQAISATSPRWRLQRGRRSVIWHDSRVQGLPTGVDHGAWTVPLIVDGHRTSLQGELRRFPAPPVWPWLCVLAGFLAAGAQPLLMRRRDLAHSAAIGFAWMAAGATVLIVLAFALDAYASPGTWIVGLDAIAFLAVGLGVILRGPRNLHIAAAIWIGLIALAVGLLDGPIFLHPIALAVLPGTVLRILTTAAIGAGLNAAVVGAQFFAEVSEGAREIGATFALTSPEHDPREHM
ncbi:MAG: hypothetical protein WBQ18_08695 [Solirubrobacteraceae bacterium]